MRALNRWATESLTSEGKTQYFYNIFTKTIGQSHKNHKILQSYDPEDS